MKIIFIPAGHGSILFIARTENYIFLHQSSAYVGAEFMKFVHFWPIYYRIVREAAKSYFLYGPATKAFTPPPFGLVAVVTLGFKKQNIF